MSARALCVAVVVHAAAGCAAAHPIGPMDTGAVLFRDTSYDATALRESGIAVLPLAPASPSSPADVGVASRHGRRVAIALREKTLAAVVLPPAEVRERLLAEGLPVEVPWGEDWTPEALERVSRATGCRFVLRAAAGTGTSVDVAVPRGKGALFEIPYAGKKPRESRAVTTDLAAQLWDASTGTLVWAGRGGGAALTNAPHYGHTNQTDALAIDGLAARLGQDPSTQPELCHVADLHARDHAQAASVAATNREIASILLFNDLTGTLLFYLVLGGITAL